MNNLKNIHTFLKQTLFWLNRRKCDSGKLLKFGNPTSPLTALDGFNYTFSYVGQILEIAKIVCIVKTFVVLSANAMDSTA